MGSQKFHLIAQFRAYFVIYTPKLGFVRKTIELLALGF